MVELSFVTDTQYESIRNHLIKKAKKNYHDCDGIILKLNKKAIDHAEEIQFN